MALTKAQVSLVTVATLGITPGAYLAQLQAFNTQKEAAAFIATTGLLNEGTNAEYALQVVKNLGAGDAKDLYKALEAGASRADATVDFANAVLVAQNGSLAQVNKAIASTSTSADLAVLKAELSDPATNGLRVEFAPEHQDQDDSVGTTSQTIYNIGKAQIDAGDSKISKDFTFELKNQIGENATYTGNFLSPILDQARPTTSGSTIVVELRNLREPKGSETPLKDLPTNGFGFTLNGELVRIASRDIFEANTYADLLAAIKARVEELGRGENLPEGADAALYAKLATFEVTLGAAKDAEEIGTNGEVVVTHDREVQPIILKDMSDDAATLAPAGWSYEANPDVGGGGYTFFGQMTDAEGQSTQFKIATNLEANNVGYGSQGATVNLVGQSASDKGIQELHVNTTNNAWFTKLQSQKNANTTNHLEIVNVNGDGYFRVGTQKNDPFHLAALVDEDFSKAGLVDVQQLNAGSLAGSVAVNSYITDAVIKRFDLEDTDADHLKDNKDALINYNLTSGNDVLQIKIDSEVVAYADAVVNINAGAGNDFVHLQIDQGHAYGDSWLANQQLNDNINITATSGNNIIWTEGAGNANITTSGGADTIYADNSARVDLTKTAAIVALEDAVTAAQQTLDELAAGIGATGDLATAQTALKTAQDALAAGLAGAQKLIDLGYGTDVNALFAFNASSLDLEDIVSNSDNGLSGGVAAPGVDQTYATFKNTVTVNFLGFEATANVSYDANKLTTNTQQINQAIKKAIADDAVLSKLIVAKEFPGNVLVVESLIDGVMAATDLVIEVNGPAETSITSGDLTKFNTVNGTSHADESALETALGTIAGTITTDNYDTGFVTDTAFGGDIVGANSVVESDNVINAGSGTDVIVLGTSVTANNDSNDTVVLTGNFGHNTIVNFTVGDDSTPGYDLLDFTSYLKAADGAVTKAAAADTVTANDVTILEFAAITNSDIAYADKAFTSLTVAQQTAAVLTGAAVDVTGLNAGEKSVVLIGNGTFDNNGAAVAAGANTGEFLVFELTGNATSTNTSVKLVGTLDFGADATTGTSSFDFAGFDNANLAQFA